MTYKKKTNKRAQAVAKKLSVSVKKDKGKLPSMKQIMKDANYSDSYANNPQLLKNSKTFNEYLEDYLPEELVVRTHGNLIQASEIAHYIFPTDKLNKKSKTLTNKQVKDIVESVPGCRLIYIKRDKYLGTVAFFQQPDNSSRDKALDKAYKVRGNYAPEQIAITKRKYQHLSNAELAALEKKLKDFLLKR